MVADIKISRAGKVTGYEFYPSVMHSQARLTYNQVNDYLVNPNDKRLPKSLTGNKDVKKSVDTLHQLYELLLKKREERHAMEFETLHSSVSFFCRFPFNTICVYLNNFAFPTTPFVGCDE